LRLGATPLLSADDVLEVFGLVAEEVAPPNVSETANAVLTRLRDGPASADELARSTGLDAGVLSTALTELELAGVAVASGGVFRAN
jgi:predicted Rossmann fold nucleotide-binding protein DprA/Smf involved in DNA uptake